MADVKISDATPVGTLQLTDLIPVARAGSPAPYNASMQQVATFITQLASTEEPQMSAKAATPGIAEQYARADHVHPSDGTRAPIDSPQFKGLPTAPTMLPSDVSDMLATTKFVHLAIEATPSQATTPAIDDNSEAIATTEFVQNQGSTAQPLMDGVPTAGVSQRFSRGDHTHPTDTTRAPASAVPAASSTPPLMNGAAAPGAAASFARGDHVHPTDTSRAPIMGVTDGSDATAGQVGEFRSAQ